MATVSWATLTLQGMTNILVVTQDKFRVTFSLIQEVFWIADRADTAVVVII